MLEEGQWSFDRFFFIILNQSVGYGNWHAPDPHATYETEFDWVSENISKRKGHHLLLKVVSFSDYRRQYDSIKLSF